MNGEATIRDNLTPPKHNCKILIFLCPQTPPCSSVSNIGGGNNFEGSNFQNATLIRTDFGSSRFSLCDGFNQIKVCKPGDVEPKRFLTEADPSHYGKSQYLKGFHHPVECYNRVYLRTI